jgi:ribosomal protein L13E
MVSDLDEFPSDEPFSSQNPIKEARDYAKRLEKKVRELEKEKADLTAQVATFERKERQGTKIAELAKAGLNEKHAKLFMAVNPDLEEITPEAVKAFVEEYALVTVSSNGDGEPSPEPGDDTGFTPAAVPGFGNGPSPSRKVYKRDEFIKLQETDPAQALLVLQEGRVQLETNL